VINSERELEKYEKIRVIDEKEWNGKRNLSFYFSTEIEIIVSEEKLNGKGYCGRNHYSILFEF
jgi:hypothetical protein